MTTHRTKPNEISLSASIQQLPHSDNWGVHAAELLLNGTLQLGCSDLHIVCQRDLVEARGRRDGALIHLASIPSEYRELLAARIKVLAKLPAFVRQEPQDGRIDWRCAHTSGETTNGSTQPATPSVTLRVSFLPTIHGENIVIRFPEQRMRQLALSQLGMSDDILASVKALLTIREGAILLTGPSSSGKTTTMYSMLQHLHTSTGERLNIVTIEDPVERDLGFAGQVQVNEQQGLSFEQALRASLRQDPNVLMIGEVRDEATARIAIQAGMTGHLVLSTIHAGRAARVFSRLLCMGIEPYLVASALSGVMAQRLVRRLCSNCRTESTTSGWSSEGCEQCSFTGIAGRVGLFEMIRTSEKLREIIMRNASPDELLHEAAKQQSGNIPNAARELALQGEISMTEYHCLLSAEEQD